MVVETINNNNNSNNKWDNFISISFQGQVEIRILPLAVTLSLKDILCDQTLPQLS
jgi:hypothetical protein